MLGDEECCVETRDYVSSKECCVETSYAPNVALHEFLPQI